MTFIDEELETLEKSPDYRRFLKVYIKYQMSTLCQKLADVGEESFVVTANASDGTFSHVASSGGDGFLEKSKDIKWKFLSFCSSTDHLPKSFESRPSTQVGRARSTPEESQITIIEDNDPSPDPEYTSQNPEFDDQEAEYTEQDTEYTQDTEYSEQPENTSVGHPGVRTARGSDRHMFLTWSETSRDEYNTSNRPLLDQPQQNVRIKTEGFQPRKHNSNVSMTESESWPKYERNTNTRSFYGAPDTFTADVSKETEPNRQAKVPSQNVDSSYSSTCIKQEPSEDPEADLPIQPSYAVSSCDDDVTFSDATCKTEDTHSWFESSPMELDTDSVRSQVSSPASDVTAASYDESGQRIHQCSTCLKKFKSASYLIVHTRIHTGERPFQCQFCEKGFYDKTALNRHVMSHLNIKPHVCTICGSNFNVRPNLTRHLKTCRKKNNLKEGN